MRCKHAALFCYDKATKIVHAFLRRGTTAAETKENIVTLGARTGDSIMKLDKLYGDRGPEVSGTLTALKSEGVAPVLSAEHGATVEAVVRRSVNGTRACRIRAGYPKALWPCCLIATASIWVSSRARGCRTSPS